MDFVVDTVFVDSFYKNILLGLPKFLNKNRRFGIRKLHLSRSLPSSKEDILEWEYKFGVRLSKSMKDFYKSTNGFSYTWEYVKQGTSFIGKIQFNSLQELTPVTDFETYPTPGVFPEANRYKLKLDINSKIFQLQCTDLKGAKVVLVYLSVNFLPTIWFYTGTEFNYLSDDFVKYFRMCIVHVGIPNWQLLYTTGPIPLSEQIYVMMRMITPTILKTNKNMKTVELFKEDRVKKASKRYRNAPINKLSPDIFAESYKSLQLIRVNKMREEVKTLLITKPLRKKTECPRKYRHTKK